MRTGVLTLLAVTAVGTSLLVPTVSRATIMERVSLAELTHQASAIVIGRVESSGVRLAVRGQGLEPQTVSRLSVSQWLLGGPAPSVSIREIGGVSDQIAMRIEGTPSYRPGEEVLVFLCRDAEHVNDFRTCGMAQGKFTIVRGLPGVPSVAWRDLSELGFARWDERGMSVDAASPSAPVQLEAVLDVVRQTLAGATP
ncbi:MAG: hypothetical protein GXP55_10045 [Deltaproteobacteria bacterium]|nr:hypothetical protein [Deltaproteobacteria bacterium]